MKTITIMVCGALLALSGHAMAGNPAAGKEKAKTCAACHGADGNTPVSPDIPKLAGQYSDYLVKTMQGYKAGTRKNAIMTPMAASLSQRDMEDLAAYYSQQKGLTTFR